MLGCTNLFFLPERTQYITPDAIGLRYQDRRITLENGETLHAWFLPAEGKEKGLVLFFHGNAQNISTHVASVAWLPARGYSVLLPDYRGYGNSDGEADIHSAQEDVRAAIAYAQAQSRHVVIFGQSLGGALAMYSVGSSKTGLQIDGMVIESAFSSYRGIAREKIGETWLGFPVQYPLSFLVSDQYSPLPVVANIAPIPILFIHGDNDEVVNVRHSKLLYEAAGTPKSQLIIPGGPHIGSAGSEEVKTRIEQFLRSVNADTSL